MQVEAIYLNTAIGLNKLLYYCTNIAKYNNNENVIRDIVRELSSLPERNVSLAYQIITQKMLPLGVYVIDGNIPNTKEGLKVSDIYATGKKLKQILQNLGFDGVDELGLDDNKRYRFITGALQIVEL